MFLSDLVIAEVDDKVFRLTEPLEYRSAYIGKKIVVPRGFETDFASVPRIPMVYSIWGDRAHREAVIHDYLYRKDSEPMVPFHTANRIFLDAMCDRGKPFYVRWPMYLAVQAFGRGSYHKLKVGDMLVKEG